MHNGANNTFTTGGILMSPEQRQFMETFSSDEAPKPAVQATPKTDYEKEFAEFAGDEPKPALGSGQYGLDSVHDLSLGVGDASPTVLENTAQGTGATMGTAEGAPDAAGAPAMPKLPSSGGGNAPKITPDHSADEYIRSFNDLARSDAADRSASARSSAQEAMKLAGK